jgi:hypothetical protein
MAISTIFSSFYLPLRKSVDILYSYSVEGIMGKGTLRFRGVLFGAVLLAVLGQGIITCHGLAGMGGCSAIMGKAPCHGSGARVATHCQHKGCKQAGHICLCGHARCLPAYGPTLQVPQASPHSSPEDMITIKLYPPAIFHPPRLTSLV